MTHPSGLGVNITFSGSPPLTPALNWKQGSNLQHSSLESEPARSVESTPAGFLPFTGEENGQEEEDGLARLPSIKHPVCILGEPSIICHLYQCVYV